MKEWRVANPEKAREATRKWRAANPERMREATRKWRVANPEYFRKYRAANREKIRGIQRRFREKDPEKYRKANTQKNIIWRANNPEKPKAAGRRFRIKNPERVRESSRKYRAENPEKVKRFRRKWKKYKRETDPSWKLTENMRSAMHGALKGKKKSASTMKIIGCTTEELWEHLESCASWKPWMTRENYGKNGWDVDHIIAISKWDKDCPLQFVLCWDKSNLQPMEHIENIKKGAK